MMKTPGHRDMQSDVRRSQAPSSVVVATGAMALIGLGLAWAAYVRRYVLHDIPMTGALNGELHTFLSPAGRLAYYNAGPAHRNLTAAQPRPLLFIHSINAASSSYEMRPLFEHYARERRVYALDLPGFGFSEREDRTYTPQLYRDAILSFVEKEVKGAPVDAVALSLGCEFLALAALERPEHFRTLTFISPTGMSMRNMQVQASDGALRFLLNPAWSRLIFDTLTSRPGIRYFLQMLQAREADRGLIRYAYITSHQPNAQYAPYYFISGHLFTSSVFMAYQKLMPPVLMIYGKSRTVRYDMVDALHAKPNWRIVSFRQCGDLVHFDDPRSVITQMDQLFARA
jgi:pimeloyl-ACP methyl ester carboxylesterase